MQFDNLIAELRKPAPSRAVALQTLRESRDPANALRLFAAASAERDQTLGDSLWWTGAVGGILPCRLDPPCIYCSPRTDDFLTTEDVVVGTLALAKIGIRHVHLSGGSYLKGYDDELLALVHAVQAVSDMALEVNLGPSLSRDAVRRLKACGVRSVTSSLETCNAGLFARTKPGDSLEGRKALLTFCQEERMPVRSMVLIGLGESEEDRIEHLFYMRNLPTLYQLRFSRFQPIATGIYHDNPRCSPWEVARVIAIARLLMPNVDLALAAGNTVDDIPLWYAAGGGNQILGPHVSRIRPPSRAHAGEELIAINARVQIASRMKQQEQYVQGFGRRINYTIPTRYQ